MPLILINIANYGILEIDMVRSIIVICVSLALIVSPIAHASEATDDSELQVSSSRLSVSVKAGETKNIEITTRNKSIRPMEVQLQVKQFTVGDTPNDITFEKPQYDWVHARANVLSLEPNKSKTADYKIAVPTNAAEKEYYYALIASTTAGSTTGSKTVQVASLLYLYVDGGNAAHISSVTDSRIPTISFANSIPYAFAIQNSGNIHLQASSSAQLRGWTWDTEDVRTNAIVLPERSRDIQGTFAAPFSPGIYTLTYGYTDQGTGKSTVLSAPIIYIPLWAIAASVLLLLITLWLWQRYRSRHAKSAL